MSTLLATLLLIAPSMVKLPPKPSELIRRHLQAIEDRGWAVTVPGDLYHAHILLPPSAPDRFGSTGQLFSGSPLMLYHSDEMLHRWRLDDGELPIERRRPRSIIGYPDGRIQPAAQLMRNPIADAVHYEWHGTIHSDELARELPELIAPRSDRTVRIGNADCVVNLIVDISPHNTGRPTITVSGRPLALTMDCKRYR